MAKEIHAASGELTSAQIVLHPSLGQVLWHSNRCSFRDLYLADPSLYVGLLKSESLYLLAFLGVVCFTLVLSDSLRVRF